MSAPAEGSEELRAKVKQAGFDYEFAKGINNLETLKGLVAAGKVSETVYKQLEETFFRVHAKNDTPKSSGVGSKVKGVFNKMMTRPTKRNPTDRIKEVGAPGRSTSRSRGISLRSRTDSVKSNFSQRSFKSSMAAPKSTKPVVEGELLKFVKKKKRKEWKPIYVVLFQDRLEFYAKKGDSKILKTVEFDSDFYVSELNKGHFKRAQVSPSAENLRSNEPAGSSDSEIEGSRHLKHSAEVLEMQHVFVVSNISQSTKIFLATESEEKKSLWVTMTVEVLRELHGSGRQGTKIWDEMEKRANKYVARKLRQSMMRPQNLEGVDGTQFQDQIDRFKTQGKNAASKSVVFEWRSTEKKRLKEVEKEKEALARRLEDKSKEFMEFRELKEKEVQKIRKEKDDELHKFKEKEKELIKYKELNEEWKMKYDELMEKYRQEAHERNQERRREEERIKQEIKNLKRRSVIHISGDDARDYEREIEMYKKKLETLQKALKIDVDELDWDGTLEQAEAKMGECLKLIIEGSTPAIQMKAQQDFDKWDQLIRNHDDYINREKLKWKEWEDENFEKNLDALNEMKTRFVPEIFAKGCSEKDLIAATGVKQKTAARIMKNRIFKFFWMDKDTIAKIHAADLLNTYASQGLDIRELRAVYSTLPDDFQNDNDGKKKVFRDNLRSRLHDLTKREKLGQLKAAEELHNDYRDKIVTDRPKSFTKAKRDKRGVNNKLKGQAAALEAFFLKQGGGTSAPAKPKSSASSSKDESSTSTKTSTELNPDADEWKKYFRMQKMNLPDGAIEQKMIQDGLDPKKWEELKKLKETGGASNPKQEQEAFDADSPKFAKFFRMQKAGLADGAIMNKMVQEGLDPGAWAKLKTSKETAAPEEQKELNPDDTIWAPYFKMKKLGLGVGQIQNKMQKDGRDPNIWSKLLDLKEKQTIGSESAAKPVSPFDFASDAPKPKEPADNDDSQPSSTRLGKIRQTTSSSRGMEEVDTEMKEPSTAEDDLKRAIKMKNKRKSKTDKTLRFDENGEPIKKPKRKTKKNSKIDVEGVLLPKKSNRRKTKKGSKTETHLLQSTPSALLRKLQVDADVDNIDVKRGSAAIKIMDYGENVRGKRQSVLGTNRKKRTLRKSKIAETLNVGVQIEDTLEEVKRVIVDEGFYDQVEGGVKTMKYGDLAMKFNTISDMLVGVLIKGKRAHELKYEGNMLFLGIHDEVKITVLKYDN